MTAWLRTLGPLGLLLAAAATSLALCALLAAVGIIAWVLSGESDTGDESEDDASERQGDEDPDPGGGEVVSLLRRPPSEPPPSEPRRAA